MSASKYDIITIGGGLAGSALARAMAERGAKVLVIESTTEFKDRIRGEQMTSWGAAEAKELGIYDLLISTCGNEMSWWDTFVGPARVEHRDLAATTPAELPNLGFYHPRMQQVLLDAAAAAGAEVRRGTRVTGVQPGSPPRLTLQRNGSTETLDASLIAACDGRSSPARAWGGFEVSHEPDRMQIAGILLHNLKAPMDTALYFLSPVLNRASVIFPQGNGTARSYLIGWKATNRRYQGENDVPAYLNAAMETGLPPEYLQDTRPDGPLATFDGADTYVEHPHRDGLALVGDAAASSDPCWGQGLSLTLRDVRELRDQLISKGDPDAAGHAYADAHDHYFDTIRTIEDWFTTVIYEPGPEADARRGRALGGGALEMQEVDAFQSGPDAPFIRTDEEVRRRFFGDAA
jgi:2-polyprenyl-6-methoxyphenol hydroxylase-like FAD-dependent oxidoreductase